MRSIRGRSGDLIDRIQLTCDTIGRSFSAAHHPRAVGVGVGQATGREHRLRCSGDGALTRLIGRAGSMIDRLSGVCSPTGATLPITPIPAKDHPMTPIVGGYGGSEFTNACTPGQLMVGLEVRSGDKIDAIRPVCAPPSQWDEFGTGANRPTGFSGGNGGSLRPTLMCPQFHFLVGLNTWSDTMVNGLRIVCRDMR